LRGLEAALNVDTIEWQRLSDNARSFFDAEVRNPEIEEANLNLFQP
jgi:hypothetical protein